MFGLRWRGLREARVTTDELRDRLAGGRVFFAGQARDDLLTIQTEWWRTLGDGTWDARSEATERRHPTGRVMHLSGDLERTATAKSAAGRTIRPRNTGVTLTIQQQGRRFYAQWLDNDPVADPSKADATMLAEHYADFLMGRA